MSRHKRPSWWVRRKQRLAQQEERRARVRALLKQKGIKTHI